MTATLLGLKMASRLAESLMKSPRGGDGPDRQTGCASMITQGNKGEKAQRRGGGQVRIKKEFDGLTKIILTWV